MSIPPPDSTPPEDPKDPIDLAAPVPGPDDTSEIGPQRLEPDKFFASDTKSSSPLDDLHLPQSQTSSDQRVEDAFTGSSEVKSAKSLWRLILLSSLAIAALVVSLNWYQAYTLENKDTSSPLLANLENEANDELTTKLSAEELDLAVRTVVAGYCSATTIEERMAFCRPVPDLIEKMTAYYDRERFTRVDVTADQVYIKAANNISGVSFLVARVNLSTARKVTLPVVQTPVGYRIDWEASALWQPCDWNELINTEGESALRSMRVLIDVSDFFIGDFSTETHLCLRLKAPKIDYPAYAYVDRSSPSYLKLAPVIAKWRSGDHGPVEVIAELGYERAVGDTHFFVILDFKSLCWINPHQGR